MPVNSCNICGGGYEVIYELPFWDLQGAGEKEYVQKLCFCKKCGFLFTGNPFTEEQLSDRYKNMSKFEFESEDYFLDETAEYKKRCIRQFHFIEAAIGNAFDSVLEVGASSGYNLSLYADKEVTGIEPSAKNCKSAYKYYQIEMYQGMFREFVKENEKTYDLILLSHTLEHIVNPFDFILQCKEICNQ